MVIFYLVLTFFNVGGLGQILANFVGVVIPTYFSIQAIKTQTKDDDSKLLAYWIVFGFLNVIEFWSGAILYLVPFYWFIKVIFLIYIGLPGTGGATMVWTKLIEPVYDRLTANVSHTGNVGHGGQSKRDEVRQAVENATSFASGASRH